MYVFSARETKIAVAMVSRAFSHIGSKQQYISRRRIKQQTQHESLVLVGYVPN